MGLKPLNQMKLLNHKDQLIEMLGPEFTGLLILFKNKRIDVDVLQRKTLNLIRKKSKQYHQLERLLK